MDGLYAANAAKLGSVAGAVPGQQFAQNQFSDPVPESFAAGLVRADQELDRLLMQVHQISSLLLGDNPKQGSGTAPQPVPNGVFDALQLLGGRMNSKLLEASDMLQRIQNKLS